jgi:hypothetical protein
MRARNSEFMARPVCALELTPGEKLHLQRVAHSKTSSQRDGLRARIVLRRAEGVREADVAGALGVSLTPVSTRSRRFEVQGLNGLKDRPGRGRKAWLPADKVRQVITRLVQPPKGRRNGAPGAWRHGGGGSVAPECASHLERQRPEAALPAHLQDLQRPAV